MKKPQDYYFKKAKQENYPARSVFKLEEAQKKHKLFKRGDRVLDLGCHPGSWSIYAARQVGKEGKVLGVDLHKTKPYQFAGAARMELLQADIFSEEIFNLLAEQRFEVVLSDMAPATTGHKFSDHLRSIELCRRALEIAGHTLVPDGHFYVKVFQGEDFPAFHNEMRQVFKSVKTVKPKSSRVESREIFLLGMNKKG